ncbi:hypothetical protein HC891_13640 [Candidatus Gracilibacteria bacterium]|nr:hypothetical protein [Candidatus Gracilibacteria bacterium]
MAQRLELEKIRLQAHIEVGVAQAKAMGEAMAAMDFKLYGTPETAQQILRWMSVADGLGAVVESAPPQLRELTGRIVDRVLPPNGDGRAQHAPSNGAAGVAANGASSLPDLSAAQPLIAAASNTLRSQLNAEQRRTLSLRAGIAEALERADASERAVLHQVQGMLALVPALAEQTVESVIGV